MKARLGSWQRSSAVVRCLDGLGNHKRSNVVRGWFRCLRRGETKGRLLPEMGLPLVKKNGRGIPSPWPVGGSEPLSYLPCRLHWFLPGEGCGCRREGAATLTPSSSGLLSNLAAQPIQRLRLLTAVVYFRSRKFSLLHAPIAK